MKGHRTGRLGEEIKKIVGAMLITEVKDPRLQGKIISVTDVDVSRDGSYATCYVSVMAGTNDKTADEEAVEHEPRLVHGPKAHYEPLRPRGPQGHQPLPRPILQQQEHLAVDVGGPDG